MYTVQPPQRPLEILQEQRFVCHSLSLRYLSMQQIMSPENSGGCGVLLFVENQGGVRVRPPSLLPCPLHHLFINTIFAVIYPHARWTNNASIIIVASNRVANRHNKGTAHNPNRHSIASLILAARIESIAPMRRC